MKKLIALILAVVIILSLSTTAFALEPGENIYLRIDLEGITIKDAMLKYENGALHLNKNNSGLYFNVYTGDVLTVPVVPYVAYYDNDNPEEIITVEGESINLADLDGMLVLDEEGFHPENATLMESPYRDEVTEETKVTKEITVYGEYAGVTPAEVISVDLAWGAMEFEYTPYEEWIPETHTYKPLEGKSEWAPVNEEEVYIFITNHSNVPIDVSLKFTDSTEWDITGQFYVNSDNGEKDRSSFSVPSAVGVSIDDPLIVPTYFRITGGEIPDGVIPNEATGAHGYAPIGMITVTISAYEEPAE